MPFSFPCVARKNRGGGGNPAHIDVGDRRRSREEDQEEQGLPEKRAVRCRTPGCVRKPGRSRLCQLAHRGMRGFFIGSLGRQTFGGALMCHGSPPFSPPLLLCISLLSDDCSEARARYFSQPRTRTDPSPIAREESIRGARLWRTPRCRACLGPAAWAI